MAAVRPMFESLQRPGGTCDVTGEAIGPGQAFVAALREGDGGLERLDVTAAAWEGFEGKDRLLAYWRATMPAKGQKVDPIDDDAVLGDLIERLGEVEAGGGEQVRFRFVVALVLMRKRQLAYEATEVEGDDEVWVMRWRGRQHGHREPVVRVVDPKLDDEQIAGLTESIGQILNQAEAE